MIPVSKPFLPDYSEFENYIRQIWERNWLTNNGPLVNELELKLKEYLKVPHLLLLNNGTVALQIAIKALELKGDIITTPFSYVATTNSIIWEGCNPVFVDINEETLNIDPFKIEEAITDKTSAILATHVYGNPCDIDAIDVIAAKYNLKVIYDAAHCFGSNYKGSSVLSYGDISTISFHATKLFHTTEGGAVVTTSPELTYKMAYQRNFGHRGTEAFDGVGINGKNSEFHAAMGLCLLNHVGDIFEKRKTCCQFYDNYLRHLTAKTIYIDNKAEWNYSYYPIIFNTEEELLRALKILNLNMVYPRRYFYPSLNQLPYLKTIKACPIAESVSKRVLCLPLYHSLREEDIAMIARFLLRAQNN